VSQKEDSPHLIIDKIGRAYGTLKHARIVSSKEGLTLISLIRLGTEMGYFPEETYELCDQLMIEIQPAHLQLKAGNKLSPEERDLARAGVISRTLESLAAPQQVSNS